MVESNVQCHERNEAVKKPQGTYKAPQYLEIGAFHAPYILCRQSTHNPIFSPPENV
jgi:hypothetical protein